MNFPDFFPTESQNSPGHRPVCPADSGLVTQTLADWHTHAHSLDTEQAARADAFVEDPGGKQFLRTIFSHSPYLTRILFSETAFFLDMLDQGPANAQTRLLRALRQIFPGKQASLGTQDLSDDTLKRHLRIAKRRYALAVACGDLNGIQSTEETVSSLSAFADNVLSIGLDYLLRGCHERGELVLTDPDHPSRGCGYFLLALGKLGGQELNYSSDIDLIALFDGATTPYCGKKTPQDCFVKLTQSLIGLIEHRTEDGYVFRTDFRLRPDPSSTPVALSIQAAERYYESTGLNWERAAFIKARPVAGDMEKAQAFIEQLRPFIWRRYLDFAAIDDIHAIKKQINLHRGKNQVTVQGQNIKTGPGGIRDIEFLAQTRQLIWGGRKPSIRQGSTCHVYRSLAVENLISTEICDRMTRCYWRLRQVEHRLQMIDDQQTHSLPGDQEGMAALAAFLGVEDAETLEQELLSIMTSVDADYATVVGRAEDDQADKAPVVFSGPEADSAVLATYLSELGFVQSRDAARLITNWLAGQYSATRGERSRRLLERLLPDLLDALSSAADPDRALIGIDTFFSELPGGVQIFSLLKSSPDLLATLSEIMGSAPRLARRLSRRPILLDAMLSSDFFSAPPPAAVLEQELADLLKRSENMEDSLNITRRWAKDRKFQLGVGILRNRADAEATTPIFSDIADILVRALQPRVEEEFMARHGIIPGSGLAVVALGKLGGQELTVASDIDLVMIYADCDPDDGETCLSNGDKALQPAVYFTRLGQRLINAITAQTPEGELYEVDLRLRPSGAQGPLVSSLNAFSAYQKSAAWTWEHMALTRARTISGPAELRLRIDRTIRDILTCRRDPVSLATNVLDMRQRMAKSRPGDSLWHIKDMPGGLVDVEFICQYLQLRYAYQKPDILHHNTVACYQSLAKNGILPVNVAEELGRAARFWHRLQGLIRLCFKDNTGREEFSRHLTGMLTKAGKAESFDALENKMYTMATTVRGHFETIISKEADGK